jgi:hypothetical protein
MRESYVLLRVIDPAFGAGLPPLPFVDGKVDYDGPDRVCLLVSEADGACAFMVEAPLEGRNDIIAFVEDHATATQSIKFVALSSQKIVSTRIVSAPVAGNYRFGPDRIGIGITQYPLHRPQVEALIDAGMGRAIRADSLADAWVYLDQLASGGKVELHLYGLTSCGFVRIASRDAGQPPYLLTRFRALTRTEDAMVTGLSLHPWS